MNFGAQFCNMIFIFLDMVSKMPDLHQNLRRKKCKKRKLGKGSKKNDSPRKKRKKRKFGKV